MAKEMIEGWIAKDGRDGKVYLHNSAPYFDENDNSWYNADDEYVELAENLCPAVANFKEGELKRVIISVEIL